MQGLRAATRSFAFRTLIPPTAARQEATRLLDEVRLLPVLLQDRRMPPQRPHCGKCSSTADQLFLRSGGSGCGFKPPDILAKSASDNTSAFLEGLVSASRFGALFWSLFGLTLLGLGMLISLDRGCHVGASETLSY